MICCSLNRQPFVWACAGLILGILSPINFPHVVSLTLTICCFIICFFISGEYFRIHKLLLLIIFASLAQLNSQIEDKQEDESSRYEIIEIGTSDRAWVRCLASPLSQPKERILIYLQKKQDHEITPGKLISKQQLTRIVNKNNPFEFDAEKYWSTKGITRMGFLDSTAYVILQNKETSSTLIKRIGDLQVHLKKQLKRHLSESQAALASAILLGDKSNLAPEEKQSFSNAGAMHVLAVSGLHVGLFLQFLLFVLGKFPRRISKYGALWISLSILILYAIITGLSASVCRAVLLFGILTIGKTYGKVYRPFNALAFSAFILLIWNPNFLFDIGFQLSYLAMLGIFIFYRPIEKLVYTKNKILEKGWQGSAVGFAATLGTFPLTLYYFHQFPNYFALSNLGLIVFAELILFLGILFLFLCWLPFVVSMVAYVLGYTLDGLQAWVNWIDALPGSVALGFGLSLWESCFLFSLVILCGWWLRNQKKYHLLVFASSALILSSFFAWHRSEQKKRQELIVWNHSFPLLTLTTKSAVHVFYPQEKNIDKLHFLLSSYLKSTNKICVYHDLGKDEFYVQEADTIKRTKHRWTASLRDQKFEIPFKTNLPESKASQGIYLPWKKFEKMETNGHQLARGAFILNFD